MVWTNPSIYRKPWARSIKWMDFLIIQGETQGRLQQIRTFPLVLWSIPSVNKWANALVLPTLFLSQGRGHAVCGFCRFMQHTLFLLRLCPMEPWWHTVVGKSWLWWWPHRSLRLAQRCVYATALLSLPFWPMELWWSSEQSLRRRRSGWFWQQNGARAATQQFRKPK